jgi:membrane-bound metal-dependent hydrolase YbcI (DUF457 family)
MLATLLADFVAFALMIGGVEGFRIVSPGAKTLVSALAFDLRYSHSLLVDTGLAVLFATAYFAWRHDRLGAAILFAAVLSHWPLDVISHPPDMPLTPGNAARFGLGLWNSPAATLIVEGLPWVLAVLVYARTKRARSGVRRFVYWSVVAFLTLAWFGNFTGRPPTSAPAMGVTSGIFFSLVVAWAYWIDKA